MNYLRKISIKPFPLNKLYQRQIIWFFVILTFVFLPIVAEPEISKGDSLEKISIKPNHKKPVIVVVGENQYTELTDFMVPYGILKRANISEIHMVAPNKGVMEMFPTLSIEIPTSLSDFDKSHPEGADLVIVPAIHNADNKTIIEWIQDQYKKGATIVGICDGVWTLGYAGLLQDKKATGHWYSKEGLNKTFPDTEWIRNKRYIQDQKIITTTGVTASIPISLAIIEAIAGTKKAKEITNELGIINWNSNHNSDDFHLDWNQYLTAGKNLVSFWNHEVIGIKTYEGIDEVSLALVADAYSRTYKSKTLVTTNGKKSVLTKSGIRIFSELNEESKNKIHFQVEIPKETKAFPELNQTLFHIQRRYGKDTMQFVATQLEFSLKEFCHYVTCQN
ncbi:DJ-1/PfpI family protein [Leptospira congkakensis]|uniref:DJ-1/PfpI family protein n=1 Tax=Leptospira congkakensis TaxID=2484932 RepID=A0A4Z1AAY5_9LEPT|nr:DJ-1/PfpI family protein [Leptospira congkakensis]TGL88760.1 DJ-1/PfpI family protein [Leptospira congkakensis]TGL89346.1 DJ-1/PfpI family protein [Leptospira congkakensis]TGL97314.1 DJ-1/PfpI family protein [Leptospira congkakensis]